MRSRPLPRLARLLALPVLALGALPACRDATPLAPDRGAADAAAPASAAPLLTVQRKPDRADYVQTFARDVFVIVGSTLRNPDDATDDAKSLFNVAGVALDLTWGDWKRASATSVAQTAGPWTDASIQLTGLVPRGVYSVFYVSLDPDSENPLCPGVERALPFPSVSPKQLPDASSFVAGADGTASFRGRAAGDLFAPLQLIFEIVYHLDGRTYGPLPNRGEFLTQGAGCRSSYGEDAMRQLLIVQKGF